ncbi:hypothetical protein [Polyangium sp. 15x6]|uniref:WD40 repeat domain-containing protein n=1 Tax=Polyangium sp. 15x6 TaxID=3042687 RepID=UPI00249B97F2|nr:hypothetical protein [Polyangium sp. 15x6]MDI3283817.1 hypothetical protein [Polyangium sp. 15x6]
MNKHGVLALAIAATTACRAPPAAPGAAPVRLAKSAAPVRVQETAAPASAALRPPPTEEELALRVADAYDRRARGDTEAAAAAFEALVKELLSLGRAKAPGLGDAGDGVVVRGRMHAGFTERLRSGAWFFDIETGEPFAYLPGMLLKRGPLALDGSYFVTSESAQLGLFDPTRRRSAKLPGALVSVHPDGRRAYVLGEDCRLREVGLETEEVLRTLATPATKRTAEDSADRPECSSDGFRDAAITADGKWLSTRVGRWNLTSGAHRPLPRGGAEDYVPAISPDGRYVARIAYAPGATSEWPRAVVQLLDLDTGAVKATSPPMSPMSHAYPLSFGSDPPRVCVFDYGFSAFEVPSLRTFEPGHPAVVPERGFQHFGAASCDTNFVRPPSHPDLAARLASRVCYVGGYLVPVAHCGAP